MKSKFVKLLLFSKLLVLVACQTKPVVNTENTENNKLQELPVNEIVPSQPPQTQLEKKIDKLPVKKRGWNYHLTRNLSKDFKFLKQNRLSNKTKTGTPMDEAFFKLGKQALELKQGEIASEAFSECIDLKPNNVECHWERGWSYYLLREFKKSLKEFKWVYQKQPKRKGLESLIKKISLQSDYRNLSLKLRKKSPKSYSLNRVPNAQLVKIKAIGDTMLGSSFPEKSLPPEDLSILEFATPYLSSDVVLANYEGTICEAKETIKCSEDTEGSSCFSFSTPPSYVEHLKKAKINLVSLANNHIMDFGEDCRDQTEKNLDAAQIPWSGRKGTVARFFAKDIPYSMIGFHSALHTNSTLDLDEAERMIKVEKESGRIVIVMFHGGAEGIGALHIPTPASEEIYFGESRGNVVEFSHRAIDAGADLVIGAGPHVVRGMEFYKERLIAYSLGNFATYKLFNLWGFAGLGVILEVDLEADGRFHSGKIIPMQQIQFGLPVLDKRHAATDLIRMLSKQDFPETGVDIAKDGTIGVNKSSKRSVAELDLDPDEDIDEIEVDEGS